MPSTIKSLLERFQYIRVTIVEGTMPLGKRKLRVPGFYRSERMRRRMGYRYKKRGARYSRMGGKGKFRSLVKKIVLATSESKFKDVSFGKTELYHNGGTTFSPANFAITTGSAWPTPGDQRTQRTGDFAYMSGIQLKFMLGHKADRPNVTFRMIVYSSKSGLLATSLLLDLVTNNVMLDSHRDDIDGRIILDRKFTQPKTNTALYDANKECTYFKKIWIPMKRKVRWQDGSNAPVGFDDMYVAVYAYDAYGTLVSDNIAYMQLWSRICFRDP